jgi:hypothetical protein
MSLNTLSTHCSNSYPNPPPKGLGQEFPQRTLLPPLPKEIGLLSSKWLHTLRIGGGLHLPFLDSNEGNPHNIESRLRLILGC